MPLCREFEDVPQFVPPRGEAEVQEKLLPGSGVSPDSLQFPPRVGDQGG